MPGGCNGCALRTAVSAMICTAIATAAAPDSWVCTFESAPPGPEWRIDVSGENRASAGPNGVEIVAAENTYAHLERELGIDSVSAQAVLKPGNGISWATSLFLYWGPGDWCQLGVIPRGDGRYYVCVTTQGQREEHDLTRCTFDDWHTLAIELCDDAIRFRTKQAAREWRTELFVSRGETLRGPPAKLMVGKGFGLDGATPDLNGDYGERGAVATSYVRRVEVAPLEAARRKIGAEERRAAELADRDPHGMAILERPGEPDPDFDTVAAVFPPLQRPREVVGVPEHRYEFGVDYDGTVQFPEDEDGWEQKGKTQWFEVGDPPIRFGDLKPKRRLALGYAPIVTLTAEWQEMELTMEVGGYSRGLRPDAPTVSWITFNVKNNGREPKKVLLAQRYKGDRGRSPARWDGTAEPGVNHTMTMYSPPLGGPAGATPASADPKEALGFWEEFAARGTQVTTPEPRVNNAWRAWLAYNAINVDKIGDRYDIHDGAGFYEEVFGYSAALYCNALDLWGRHEESQRYLDALLTRLREDGLFFVRYGLPDHGALMFALVEHYRLTGDAEWLRRVAPQLVRMGDWTLRQRAAAAGPVDGPRPATFGLIRFMPYADYPGATCNYYADAYCCVGLERAAAVLGDAGRPEDAARFAAAAAEYRRDILASMDAAVVERDGQKLLPIEPETQRLLKSVNYRGGGYYGLVASMLLETEFLPADDPRAKLLVDALERRRGLILGMCEFDDGIDHAYTYGYWLDCLRREEVRRVLLGFYGSLAYGMDRDTYCGVEVTQITTGMPTPTTPHTYSGTQQLRLLRMMLVREEGERLLLGQAIPRHWLRPGAEEIRVRGAATRWGPVSYSIRVGDAGDRIVARIEPPARGRPAIELRVRHPEKRPIRQVRVNGADWTEFGAESIRLGQTPEAVEIEATY